MEKNIKQKHIFLSKVLPVLVFTFVFACIYMVTIPQSVEALNCNTGAECADSCAFCDVGFGSTATCSTSWTKTQNSEYIRSDGWTCKDYVYFCYGSCSVIGKALQAACISNSCVCQDQFGVSCAANWSDCSGFFSADEVCFPPSSSCSYTCCADSDCSGGQTCINANGPTSYCLFKPDLTASAPTPNNALAGVSKTFSSTISNSGGATASNFNNFFQIATGPGGTGTLTDLPSSSMSALAAGGSGTASVSYAFPSIGTPSIRVCADKSNRNNAGTITESNEANNCSGWTDVNVTNAASSDDAQCISISSSDSVVLGGSLPVTVTMKNTGTKTWDTATPYGLTAQPWPNLTWTGSIWNVLPSATIAPNATAVFNFSVTAPATAGSYSLSFKMLHNGVAWFGTPCTKTVSVTSAPPSATATITANPVNISYGGSSNLSWSYANASSCTVTGQSPVLLYPNGSGAAPTGALYLTKPYTISCDPGGANSTVTINVPLQPRSLVVVKAGQGKVVGTSNPIQTNVNCGVVCDATYDSGTEIKLIETPNAGRIFNGWSGVSCSEGNQKGSSCTFTIGSSDLTIIASFLLDPNYREF